MKMNQKIAAAAVTAGLVTAGIFGLNSLRADAPASTQPAANAPSATQPVAVNTKCPISGDPIDSKITTVYDGKTYAFCCGDCIKAFSKDPAKYAAAAK